MNHLDKNSILDVADSEKEKADKASVEAEKAEHEEAPVEPKQPETDKAEATPEAEKQVQPEQPVQQVQDSDANPEAEKSTAKKDDDEDDVEESTKDKKEKEDKEKSFVDNADIIKSITEPLNQFKEELKKSDDSLKEELSKTNDNLTKAIDTLSGLAQAIQDVVGAGKQNNGEDAAPSSVVGAEKSADIDADIEDNKDEDIVAKSAEAVAPVVDSEVSEKENPETVATPDDNIENTVYKALQIEPQYVDRFVEDSKSGKLSEVQKSYLNDLSREVHYTQTEEKKDYDEFINYAETGKIPEIPTDYFG